MTRVHKRRLAEVDLLADFDQPLAAATLRSAGTASSRLPSRTSTVGAISGTLAAIFSLLGSKKWIIREGLNGTSRGGAGRADRKGLSKIAGVSHGQISCSLASESYLLSCAVGARRRCSVATSTPAARLE